jgi:hypothetical protein
MNDLKDFHKKYVTDLLNEHTNYIKRTTDEHTAECLRMREDGIKARTFFNKQIDENKKAHHVEIQRIRKRMQELPD